MPLGREEKDFDYMVLDAGVPVVYRDTAGVRTEGYGVVGDADLDQVAAEEGRLAAHEKLVTVSRQHFPMLVAGGTLEVDDVEYLITQVRETGDGLPLRVWLTEKA